MIEIDDGNDTHHRDNVVVVKFKIARCLGTDAAVRRHPNIDLLIRLWLNSTSHILKQTQEKATSPLLLCNLPSAAITSFHKSAINPPSSQLHSLFQFLFSFFLSFQTQPLNNHAQSRPKAKENPHARPPPGRIQLNLPEHHPLRPQVNGGPPLPKINVPGGLHPGNRAPPPPGPVHRFEAQGAVEGPHGGLRRHGGSARRHARSRG